MPHIDLVICQLCYGSRRIIAATNGDDGIAGTIKPCICGSGVEAITEEGEVMSVGKVTNPCQHFFVRNGPLERVCALCGERQEGDFTVEQWLQSEMTAEVEKRMKTSSNAGGKLSHHAEPMDR